MSFRSHAAILAIVIVGCSSPTRPTAPVEEVDARVDSTSSVDSTTPVDSGTDSGTVDTSTVDTTVVAETMVDAEKAGDAYPAAKIPVGKSCKVDAECDVAFEGIGLCSNALYAPDPTDPNPVCVARGCKIGSGGTVERCGIGGVGVCTSGGPINTCLPACTFGTSDGAAPVGCLGKNACSFFGVTTSGGVKGGIGYCLGGCSADSDCTGGGLCQVEEGTCVAKVISYAKAPGAACTSSTECACRIDIATSKGFCTRFCTVGSSTAICPSGMACDANLPSATFTKTPAGIAGECRPKCTSDASCAPYGGRCDLSVEGGVCRP